MRKGSFYSNGNISLYYKGKLIQSIELADDIDQSTNQAYYKWKHQYGKAFYRPEVEVRSVMYKTPVLFKNGLQKKLLINQYKTQEGLMIKYCSPCTDHGLISNENAYMKKVNKIDETVNKACQFFKLDLRELKTPEKKDWVVIPRQMIMVLLSERGIKDRIIGDVFNRDRTSVIHARKVFRQLNEVDPEYNMKYNDLKIYCT